MTRRSDRVEDLLRAEISELLRRRVADPRLRLASVAEVDLSPDLRHALVRLSVMGTEEQRRDALVAARRATPFFRRQLALGLRSLRYQPELEFELDRGAEHSDRISHLLESLETHDDGT